MITALAVALFVSGAAAAPAAARPDVQGDARVRAFLARPEDFGCSGGTSTPEGFRLVRCRPPLKLTPRPPAASGR